MVTFFVAAMTFDVKRIKAGRRDCLPVCLAPQPKDGERPWDEPRLQTSNRFMEVWAKLLVFPASKLFVLLMSIALLAMGIYGTTKVTERSAIKRTVLGLKLIRMSVTCFFVSLSLKGIIVDSAHILASFFVVMVSFSSFWTLWQSSFCFEAFLPVPVFFWINIFCCSLCKKLCVIVSQVPFELKRTVTSIYDPLHNVTFYVVGLTGEC